MSRSARAACGGLLIAMLQIGGATPYAKLSQLDAENRRLSQQAEAQLAEIENLKVHAREVEDRLLQAEQDKSSTEARGDISRKKLANLARERERLRQRVVVDGASRPAFGNQLALLARRYPNLHYDTTTGIGRVDTDILFDSGGAELKPGAQKLLAQLANMLDSTEAQGLRVIVVGHTDDEQLRGAEARGSHRNNWHLSTARANAVADELRRLGLPGERLGVAGFGSHQSIARNDQPASRGQNRRVEIFLASPEVPVVGMTETLTNLY